MTSFNGTTEDEDVGQRRTQRYWALRRREWAFLSVFLLMVLLFGINFKLVTVDGHSMQPTYVNGQTVLVWRTAALARPFQVGDVIVFRAPDGGELIKRIFFVQDANGAARLPKRIWTPFGLMSPSLVLWTGGHTYFPGYQDEIDAARHGVPVVKTIFVMGDNIADSIDSRDFGPIDPRSILGRVVGPLTHPGAGSGKRQSITGDENPNSRSPGYNPLQPFGRRIIRKPHPSSLGTAASIN